MELDLEDGLYEMTTKENLSPEAQKLVDQCQDMQARVMRKYTESVPSKHPERERLMVEAMRRAMDDPAYRHASQTLADVYLMNPNTSISLRRLDVEEQETEKVQGQSRALEGAARESRHGHEEPGRPQ